MTRTQIARRFQSSGDDRGRLNNDALLMAEEWINDQSADGPPATVVAMAGDSTEVLVVVRVESEEEGT